MHDERALEKFEEIAYKELNRIVEKGELTPQTLANAKELMSILKDIPEVKKAHHMDDEIMEPLTSYGYGHPRYYDIRSYDGYPFDDGVSERRGRNPMTGRYMSGDGMQPDMANAIQKLMDRVDRLEKK